MNILITGAAGFVGRNLLCALENLRDGKDRTRPALRVDALYACDLDTTPEQLCTYTEQADFVFHLAGVNRPRDPKEFESGNRDFTETLLDDLRRCGNTCPVMLASSVQATLTGRYQDSAYGRSKRAAEELVFAYGRESGAEVLVYRLPNLFGKWCRPNYNSVVATFCHNIARDLPITVNDSSTELELLYIDDLVCELLDALEGRAHRAADSAFCAAPVTHRVTLGEIAELLTRFRAASETLFLPEIPAGSFAKKLYSTYLSYLPPERVAYAPPMHADARGSFTELIKTAACGQVSVNVSKPGITKGQHWHNSKWELFIVVSGRALIEQRRIGSEEVLRFEVDGDHIQAVHMLPGYTHNIINLSETEDLVTLMWANEPFDPARPDTYAEPV